METGSGFSLCNIARVKGESKHDFLGLRVRVKESSFIFKGQRNIKYIFRYFYYGTVESLSSYSQENTNSSWGRNHVTAETRDVSNREAVVCGCGH